MSQSIARWLICSVLATSIGVADAAAPQASRTDQAIAQLRAEVSGARVNINPATGTARFVRIAPTSSLQLADKAPQLLSKEAAASFDRTAATFLNTHGAVFGLRAGSAELALRRSETDELGQTHLTYAQRYAGIPVFGAQLKVHFDANGRITIVNGTAVPDINVSPMPSRSDNEAVSSAVKFVKMKGAAARGSRLLVYREGLAKGVPGANHLAYEVEVSNGTTRDFVYVDAHTNKVIDVISGAPDALNRRAYDAMGLTAPGPNYPLSPFWVEGQPFPTGNVEADNMIRTSGETYNLFRRAFGRDSYDGAGATMDSIFNRGNACPNASWNGVFISFCPGLTTDDVTGHEWAHAYTEYTDGLIYAWQSGALNEAASDIFGEIVDRLNTHDDVPGNNPRTAGACSVHTEIAVVTVNTPAAIAGDKVAGTAGGFGAQTFNQTGNVTLVNDGSATPTFGCGPLVGFPAGDIALVDRGACAFTQKATNAQAAGASGVIIANNAVGAPPGMAGTDPTITIPVLSVTLADGTDLRNNLPANVTMKRGGTGTDASARWLMGEDSTAPGLVGALRDMWEPNCYVNPNRVNDPLYHCATTDNGGVHINSGVDNRAFSLLVDGGTHNGETVSAIGMTKAAHIWYRAKVAYQYPATTFEDHADALEQSCDDLIGRNLKSLATGTLSGQKITAGNCRQVKKAMRAVEMREDPVQCGFVPMLAQNPPAVCPSGTRRTLFTDNFENRSRSAKFWSVSNSGTTVDFTEREWSIVGDLPDGRNGKAFFGPDFPGGTCASGGDETAVLHLEGPAIEVPPGNAPRVVFDHWMSAEANLAAGPLMGWDGGNLKVSVNGGAFQLVPPAAFVFNAYNAALLTTAQGNSNPLQGQPAYTGADGGVTSGSWYRSIVDLTGIAAPGDFVRLRFDFGNDGCGGWVGWYVDNVKVQQCR